MRKLARLTVVFFLFLLATITLDVHGLPAVQLTILHVNDFHGHLLPDLDKSVSNIIPVGGAARLAQMIADERAKNPDGTLLLSAGDMFQGPPISNYFHGFSVIEVMNYLKFDAMVLGNHEFDWGPDILKKLAATATFPLLAANLQDQGGQSLPFTKPWVILERQGLKIAVIGIITPETAFTTKPDNVAGLTFSSVVEGLPQLVRKLQSDGVDLLVVLSHAGFDADEAIARLVPGIDVIVGGHSHTTAIHPHRVNNTIIVQAGCHGAWLGVLQLDLDSTTHRILAYTREYELKPVLSGPYAPVDEKAAAIVTRFHNKIKHAFARVVGETTVDLLRNYRAESNVGNLVADALRDASGADLAFQNGGGIRADIPKGKITREQVYTLLPFDNSMVSMDLTGRQIIAILERNASPTHQMLQVSGLTVHYDFASMTGSPLISVHVGNQLLEPTKTYRVATNDFLAAGGDEFTVFKEGRNLTYGDQVRDIIAAYLKKHSPVHPEIEQRVVGKRSVE